MRVGVKRSWWTYVEAEGEPWLGLRLHVREQPPVPPRVHVQTSHQRLRVVASETPLLGAALDPRHEGVRVPGNWAERLRLGLPVGPIRSAEFRHAPGRVGDVGWFKHWCRYFARERIAGPELPYGTEWLPRAYCQTQT